MSEVTCSSHCSTELTIPAQPPRGMSGKSRSVTPYLTRTFDPGSKRGCVADSPGLPIIFPVTDFRSQWFPDTQVGFSPPSCPGSNVVGDVEGRPDRRSAPGVAPLVSRSDRTATDSRSRLCSRWSSPVVVKEPLLQDRPELIPHLGTERPILGKCLKALLDQLRRHEGENLDDGRQVTPGRVGTLDPLQFAEEQVGTRLRLDPFHRLDDLDAFLPVVVTGNEEAQKEDSGLCASITGHGHQQIQPGTELLLVIGKGLFQNTVEGELG